MKKIIIFVIMFMISFYTFTNENGNKKYYWEEQKWSENFLNIVFEQDFKNYILKEYPPEKRASSWLKLVKDVIELNLDKAFREGIAKLESNDKTKCFAEKIKNSFGKISALQVTLKMDDHVILNGQKKLARPYPKSIFF